MSMVLDTTQVARFALLRNEIAFLFMGNLLEFPTLDLIQSNIKLIFFFGERKACLDLLAHVYVYQAEPEVPMCPWIHRTPLILGSGLTEQKRTFRWSMESTLVVTDS